MKQVELVRARLAKGMDTSLRQFLSWLSCTEGNTHETDQLRGALNRTELKPEPELVAKLTETVLEHLGHVTRVNGRAPYPSQSRAGRVAAKL